MPELIDDFLKCAFKVGRIDSRVDNGRDAALSHMTALSNSNGFEFSTGLS